MKSLLILILLTVNAFAGDNVFIDQIGSGNNINITQTDNNKNLELYILGNNNNVSVTQQGSGNHTSNIQIQNVIGPSTVILNQSGNIGKSYSIQQSCMNPAGCSVTVTQQ